jgi:hypothetical protein
MSPERKAAHQLAFDHYLRTGERLTTEEWLLRNERKFNPYHDEIGRFTSPPGATVSYGNQAVRRTDGSSPVARPRHRATSDRISTSTAANARRVSNENIRIGNSRRDAVRQSTASQPNDANSGARPVPSARNERPRDGAGISTLVGTVTPDRLTGSDPLGLRKAPHADLSAGATAVSFGLRHVGAGTYRQVDPNPHAVRRYSDLYLV